MCVCVEGVLARREIMTRGARSPRSTSSSHNLVEREEEGKSSSGRTAVLDSCRACGGSSRNGPEPLYFGHVELGP